MENEIIAENINVYPKISLDIYKKNINSKVEANKGTFDSNLALKNLIEISSYFDKENLKHGIIYGTLLGLYRDKKLISHDYDVDVYILGEDFKKLILALQNIKNIDFRIIRYSKRLISIEKDDHYIDIYIFRKYLFYRKSGPNIIHCKFLDKFNSISLTSKEFRTPYNIEEFLLRAYGKDWRIPQKGKNACITNIFFRIMIRIIGICKSLFNLNSYKKLIKKF